MFGKFIETLRSERPAGEHSLAAVCREMQRVSGVKLARSTLYRYEQAERTPDVWSVHGLAAVYGLPFDGMTNALRHELTAPSSVSVAEIEAIARDPFRHGLGGTKARSKKAGADATLTTDARVLRRIDELEAQNKDLLGTLARVADAADNLLRVARRQERARKA